MAASALQRRDDLSAGRVVTDPRQVRLLVQTFLRHPKLPVYLDIETTGLDPRAGMLICLQLVQKGTGGVVLDLRAPKGPDYAPGSDWTDALAPLFDGSVLLVGHNLKFDLGWLLHHLDLRARRVYDTMIAEQLLVGLGKSDARKQGVSFHLKDLVAKYTGQQMSKEERNWFIDLDSRPDEWTAPLPSEQIAYGLADVEKLEPIFEAQLADLRAKGLLSVAQLEMRVLPALVEIEQVGVQVDVDGWRQVIQEKAEEAAALESEVLAVLGPPILEARAREFDTKLAAYTRWCAAKSEQEARLKAEWEANRELADGPWGMAWGQFKIEQMKVWRAEHPNPGKPKPDHSLPNLHSVPQLLTAFRALGVVRGYDRDGTAIPLESTDSDTLKQFRDEYEPVELLLRWRKATKFVDAFGEALLRFVGPDGRIHPEYQQIGASTGRMSCARPNWQQVPSKGDGKRLRALVRAAPGNVILTADFSNIEARIGAEFSGDETLLEVFDRDLDLHTITARKMFGLDETVDVKHELVPGTVLSYRDVAKTINYGLFFGMSPSKLARTIKQPVGVARELFDRYFETYPGVKSYLERAKEQGIKQLKSVTASGRVRYYSLPPEPVFPRNEMWRKQAYFDAREEYKRLRARIERQAMNTSIQGTSADITKLALALFHHTVTHPDNAGTDCSGARVIAVVHDEIVVEAPEWASKQVGDLLAECMDRAQKTYLHRVKLPRPEVVISDHWAKE